MHRVELKAQRHEERDLRLHPVPNAPCGVESCLIASLSWSCFAYVPNAPCGVEREEILYLLPAGLPVPNAPCGVERSR